MQNRASSATPAPPLSALFAPNTEAKTSESASSSYVLPDAPKEIHALRHSLKDQISIFCRIELEKIKNLVRKTGAQIPYQKVYQLHLANFIQHLDKTDIVKSENNPLLSETEIQQNIARLVYRFNSVNNLAVSIYSDIGINPTDFTFLQDYLNARPDRAGTCLSLSRQDPESEIGFARIQTAIKDLEKTTSPEAASQLKESVRISRFEETPPVTIPAALPEIQDFRKKTIADFLKLLPGEIETEEHVHQLIFLYCALSEARVYVRKIETSFYFGLQYLIQGIDSKNAMSSLQRPKSDTTKWPALFKKYIGEQTTVFEDTPAIAGRLSYLQAIQDITNPSDPSLQSTVRLFKQYPELSSALLEKTKDLAKNIVGTCEEFYSDVFPSNFSDLLGLINDIRRFLLMTPLEDDYFTILRYPKREARHSIFEDIARLKKITQLPIEDYLNPALWDSGIEIATRIIDELKEVEAEEEVESETHPDTPSRLPQIKRLKQDIRILRCDLLRARTGVNDLVPAETRKKTPVEIKTIPPTKQNGIVFNVSGSDEKKLSEEAKQAQKKEADSLSWQIHVLRHFIDDKEYKLCSDLRNLFKLDHPVIYNAIFRPNNGLLAFASAKGAIDFMVLFLTLAQSHHSLNHLIENLSHLAINLLPQFEERLKASGFCFAENALESLRQMIQLRESLKATYTVLKRRVEEKDKTPSPEKKPATGKRWITSAAAAPSGSGLFSASQAQEWKDCSFIPPAPPKALPSSSSKKNRADDADDGDEKMPQYNGGTLFPPQPRTENDAPPAAKLSDKERALFENIFSQRPS